MDGLTNIDEYQLITSISDSDTDHDGLICGLEIALSFDPSGPTDELFLQSSLTMIDAFFITGRFVRIKLIYEEADAT